MVHGVGNEIVGNIVETKIIEPKTILVVEDDREIRAILGDLLYSEGYEVLEADNGAVALQILHETKKPIGLILLDLMMPVMNGIEFLAKKQQTSHRTIPVVIITAGTIETIHHVADSKVPVLKKPFNIDVLLNAVKTHFSAS